MANRVEFTILGEPAPQGSKTVARTRAGASYMREDNPATRPWRERVEAAALKAMGDREPMTGTLRATITFVFPRLKSHYGTGRNRDQLKPSAPLYVRTRPDVDKLIRALGDSLTGIVCRDDAQLAIVHAEKHYGRPACAHVLVVELDQEQDRAGDAARPVPYTPVGRRV